MTAVRANLWITYCAAHRRHTYHSPARSYFLERLHRHLTAVYSSLEPREIVLDAQCCQLLTLRTILRQKPRRVTFVRFRRPEQIIPHHDTHKSCTCTVQDANAIFILMNCASTLNSSKRKYTTPQATKTPDSCEANSLPLEFCIAIFQTHERKIKPLNCTCVIVSYGHYPHALTLQLPEPTKTLWVGRLLVTRLDPILPLAQITPDSNSALSSTNGQEQARRYGAPCEPHGDGGTREVLPVLLSEKKRGNPRLTQG